jgi:hypothetical protein
MIKIVLLVVLAALFLLVVVAFGFLTMLARLDEIEDDQRERLW